MHGLGKRCIIRRLSLVIAIVVIASPLLARGCIHLASRGRVNSDIRRIPQARVALVLGAGVRPDGTLSQLLKDRVDAGIRLYKAGKVRKLLMSGDNRVTHYNEPRRMRDYAIEHGVPSDDVAMDFAGRRTYDSAYRARHIFGLREMIVVSQGWHLDRALYLCRHCGVRAWGYAADVPGHGRLRFRLREALASLGALADVHARSPKPVIGKRERI